MCCSNNKYNEKAANEEDKNREAEGKLEAFGTFYVVYSNTEKSSTCKKIQQNALKLFIISLNSTYMFRPAPAIFRVVVMKYQVQCSKRVDKIKKGAKYLVKMSRCYKLTRRWALLVAVLPVCCVVQDNRK